MNKIDYSQAGGLPVTEEHLNYLQQGYFQPMAAIAALIGSKVVVAGMVEAAGNTGDGWLSVDGELIPFVGGPIAAGIVVVETPGTELFFDGNTRNVYYTRYATFGAPADFNYGDIVRIPTMKASSDNYNALSDAFNDFVTATNITIADLLARQYIVYRGSIALGNVATDQLNNVVHNHNIAGAYMVAGSLVSLGGDYNQDNDVFWQSKNCIANSFQLALHKIGTAATNLRFDYALILL